MPFQFSSTDAGGPSIRHNHGAQQTTDAPDWDAVMASLAELGFHVQVEHTPAAADVVLAAQLRLRYWRRQLPCGRPESTSGDTMCFHPTGTGVSRSDAEGKLTGRTDDSQQVASLAQECLSEAFVRQRIRSIKSARDCLLSCSRRSLLAATESQ